MEMEIKKTTTISLTPAEIEEIILEHLKSKSIELGGCSSLFKMEDRYDTYTEEYETEFTGFEITIVEVEVK